MVPDLTEPKGRYLSFAEQEEISRGLVADLSYAEIGRRIGRHRSTVKREVDRNHVIRERRGAHAGASTPVGPARPYRRVDVCRARRDAYRAGPARRKADDRAREPVRWPVYKIVSDEDGVHR